MDESTLHNSFLGVTFAIFLASLWNLNIKYWYFYWNIKKCHVNRVGILKMLIFSLKYQKRIHICNVNRVGILEMKKKYIKILNI